MSLSEQTRLNGRQGVRYVLQEGMTVRHPETLAEVPADGQTMGEIMFRRLPACRSANPCTSPT